jgi:HK97 family phage portal protein
VGIAQTLRALDARLTRHAVNEMKSGIGWPNPGWAPPSGYVGTSATGVTINEDRANTVAAWFAGIRNISEDVAVAPLHVYRRNGRNADKATDLPVYRMLHDAPNPEMTSFTFRSTLQAHAMAWGNGYAEKELNAQGRCIALWPLRPDRMEVVWEGGKRVYHYRPTAMAQPIRITSDRVFHLPGLGFDGLQGYSLLRLARETLGQTIALREYGGRVLNNDARPGVILTHPGVLSKTARENIADSWDANHGGFGNAGRTAVLEEGITVSTIGFPPEDIQFLESQKWHVTEVARWLRIAPHKIGDLERATFSNIEEQNIDHVTSTLRAWFVRWEQQLDKDVVQDPDLFCEHNLDAALRGKTLERAQANVLKINAGAAVPNEWRAQDNQNPLPWGDDRVNTPNNTASNGASDPVPPTNDTTPNAPTGGPA